MNFTSQELATILASLRLAQEYFYETGDGFPCWITEKVLDDKEPLTSAEIDTLCERLTTSPTCAFFKVRPTDDSLSFIAWGALTPLTTDDPHSDPAEPVHYCFADTEEIAIFRVQEEMEQTYGKLQWHRLSASHSSKDPSPSTWIPIAEFQASEEEDYVIVATEDGETGEAYQEDGEWWWSSDPSGPIESAITHVLIRPPHPSYPA